MLGSTSDATGNSPCGRTQSRLWRRRKTHLVGATTQQINCGLSTEKNKKKKRNGIEEMSRRLTTVKSLHKKLRTLTIP